MLLEITGEASSILCIVLSALSNLKVLIDFLEFTNKLGIINLSKSDHLFASIELTASIQ